MKINFYSIISVLFFCFINLKPLSAQQINSKILEVYGDKMHEFAQNNPEHIARLNDLLENRIKIIESPLSNNEKYIKLSSVELLNKYNPDLKRDITYDPASFNPLKYNLNFFPLDPMVYRIDNTNYLIVVTPQTLNK